MKRRIAFLIFVLLITLIISSLLLFSRYQRPLEYHEVGMDYTIEKVTNIKDIMAFGVMVTPALAVDGEVKTAGKVPGVEEIKAMLT